MNKMIKKIFVFTSILIFSSSTWSSQNFRRVGGERWMQDGLYSASRCLPVQARLFSSTPPLRAKQAYTITTYDAAFKWVLSDNPVRKSFFKAFVPDLKIKSSERLDEHMNPVEKMQVLRTFMQDKSTVNTATRLACSDKYVVCSTKSKSKPLLTDHKATKFLRALVGRFDELQASFPKSRYDGTMDFACKLNTGDYALIEMQVFPQDYWDRRALAYVSAFYGNQLSKGDEWKHIRKVIGINILGGGKNQSPHWEDTPSQFVRHYKFEEQLHGKGRYIDGVELIQYSIMQAQKVKDQEQQDWLTFFKKAHDMSEKDVKVEIKTPAVLRAFERAKISKLPAEVREDYEAQDKEFERYSEYTNKQVAKKVEKVTKKTAIEFAKKLIKDQATKKLSDQKISTLSKLPLDEVRKLRP